MSLRSLIIVIAIVVPFATACSNTSTPRSTNTNSAPAASPEKPDEFATARATFEKNCVVCHQKSGEGGPVKLEDGTRLKVPNLREGHALRHPNSDFVKQISKGGDGMPAFKDKLTAQQINELVRFIRHDFQGGAQPTQMK